MRILLDENMPPSSAIIFPSLMSAPRNSWAGRAATTESWLDSDGCNILRSFVASGQHLPT